MINKPKLLHVTDLHYQSNARVYYREDLYLSAQPVMDFIYEVSFYYINHEFQYALYAPDPDKRWEMEAYEPSAEDLAYADKFIAWNDINYGIQRVDACRMPSGELLLMEVEDINPYLSLDLLSEEKRERFVQSLSNALMQFANL